MSAPGAGYRICARCVMDTSDAEITFTADGICNHCTMWFAHFAPQVHRGEDGRRRLDAAIQRIRTEGKGLEHDCIVGLSGGVDSSYLALQAGRLGLRPLAIHLDNSWNSETAVHNIERLVRGLEFDLVTHVIDWAEFRDLQRAYFRAGVIDIEVLTDHAITAFALETARARGVRWILSGTNHVTESLMPTSWTWRKSDLRNLKAIHRRYGEVPLRSFPTASTLRIQADRLLGRGRSLPLLNYLDYERERAKEELREAVGWRDYGGKHHESLFTRFYQAHLLPTKFGIDKRRPHLSSLICSGQMTRDDALAELEEPVYPHLDELAADQEYVLKKLGFEPEDWDAIISSAPRRHDEFASDQAYVSRLLAVNAALRRVRSLVGS